MFIQKALYSGSHIKLIPSHCLYSASFDGREFATVFFDPNTLVTNIDEFNKKLSGSIVLLIVLHGSLKIDSIEIKQGQNVFTSNLNYLSSGVQGCLASLIFIPNRHRRDIKAFYSKSSESKWYYKYKAHVSFLDDSPNESQNQLAILHPWEGYNIVSLFNEDSVELHVHKKLFNLIFVQGLCDDIVGFLIYKVSRKTIAYPVYGGDCILVHPNVIHNLVPIPNSKKSLDFFVFNSTSSKYQDEEKSDFFVKENRNWNLIEMKQRETCKYFELDCNGVH